MTKVITRLFDSVETARSVRKELLVVRRFSPGIVHLFDSTDNVVTQLTGMGVQASTAETYKQRLSQGGAVVLVQAGSMPLSVAKITRTVTAEMGAIDLGDLIEEVIVKDEKYYGSVMKDHPLMLYRPRDPDMTNFYMANWPIPLISRKKPSTFSLIARHARMANKPFPLISRGKPYTFSLFERHARMANFPIPLVSKRKPKDKFAFERHARMANFPISLISKRKPFSGTWIGRHTRMANWPFPHLINGNSDNSLVPGGTRMANFPISLLSKRKPFTGAIFSRHARMANFPISLISKRKPYTGSMIAPHARMADRFLPLVTRRRFTVSGMLGLPTLAKR